MGLPVSTTSAPRQPGSSGLSTVGRASIPHRYQQGSHSTGAVVHPNNTIGRRGCL